VRSSWPSGGLQTGEIEDGRIAKGVEHKAEHNNCRMRGPESDSEVSGPTVSP
jgi:hypothetical protein